MGFGENLQRIRREKHLSQEALAEMLNVSRQAVSKWEQGAGYPEVDKLLLLSRELNVSLDSLMAAEVPREKEDGPGKATGTITISSPYEHVVARCSMVMSSPKFKGGKGSPQYALFAVRDGASLFGTASTFLGWYAGAEQLEKEIAEIKDAIFRGIPAYELKYSVRVKRRPFGLKILY